MTKKELRWRLKELPTAEGVAKLVEQGVISKEEGRQLLLSEVKYDESKKIQALEEEVKFLRKLVDTLASKTNGYTTIYHEYHDWKPRYPWWYKQYEPIFVGYSQVTSTGSGKIGDYELPKATLSVTTGSKSMTFNAASGNNSVQQANFVSTGTASLKTLSSLND